MFDRIIIKNFWPYIPCVFAYFFIWAGVETKNMLNKSSTPDLYLQA